MSFQLDMKQKNLSFAIFIPHHKVSFLLGRHVWVRGITSNIIQQLVHRNTFVSSDNGRFTYPEQTKSLLQDFRMAPLISGLRYRSKNISSDRSLHLIAKEETNSKQAGLYIYIQLWGWLKGKCWDINIIIVECLNSKLQCQGKVLEANNLHQTLLLSTTCIHLIFLALKFLCTQMHAGTSFACFTYEVIQELVSHLLTGNMYESDLLYIIID